MEFALRQMYGCPVDRKHFSHFTKSAANAAKYRTARTIAHGVVDATAISLCWFATQTFAHLRAPKTLDNRQQLRACESRPGGLPHRATIKIFVARIRTTLYACAWIDKNMIHLAE
jgi:hypothetical protein